MNTSSFVQAMVIVEGLKAMGYSREDSMEHISMVEQDSTLEVVHCVRIYADGAVTSENLAVCKQPEEFIGNIKHEGIFSAVLKDAHERKMDHARAEGFFEGRENMKWEAQADFEQAFWEYQDGEPSNFEPRIYGDPEDQD